MKNEVLDREKLFPGSTSWGIMGTVSNAPDRWSCDSCGRDDRLVVRNGVEVIHMECHYCWQNQFKQLTLSV
jgi:hypothetical protein